MKYLLGPQGLILTLVKSLGEKVTARGFLGFYNGNYFGEKVNLVRMMSLMRPSLEDL